MWWMLAAALCSQSAEEATSVRIESTRMEIAFSAATGGVTSIGPTGGGTRFVGDTARPLLWRLSLRAGDKDEVVVDNAGAAPPQITQRARQIDIVWPSVDLPGEAGALTVRARCSLPSAGDTASVRLWVTNRSARFGLWEVHFPVIAPLSAAGKADVAIGRGNWGELHRAAQAEIAGEYPSHNLPMQLVLVNAGEDGLYLAAHDTGAWPKRFSLTPGGEFRVTTPAAGMGVAGSGWQAPYPFAIGVYRGDWMAGCKRYRAWAVRNAPWTRRGPLAKRPDACQRLAKVCTWLTAWGAAEEVVPAVERYAAAVGAPVGVHWYGWHQTPFDIDYPAYFPTKPGMREGADRLTRAGVVVMPYINARLWDSANKEFAQARAHACKSPAGDPLIEEYGSGAKLAVMCPTQSFWQERVRSIMRRLVEEYGVNAVYLDQIASAPPRTCFDASHGHPLGSGRWWVDGYRQMLEPLKAWCAATGRDIGLTSENDAEPYMDSVDGHLIWTPREAHEIPMTTAVYSGYTLYFGSNRAFGNGHVPFALCQARDFVWGAQLGWDGPALLEPAHAEELEVQARLARVRSRLLDALAYGELVRVLPAPSETPKLSGVWNTWSGNREVTLPALHAALWRCRDGSLVVVAANADTRPHVFRGTVDAALAGLRGTRWTAARVTEEGEAPVDAPAGNRFEVAFEVPARSGAALRLRPRGRL